MGGLNNTAAPVTIADDWIGCTGADEKIVAGTFVGWVERSETHVAQGNDVGLAALDPPYVYRVTIAICSRVTGSISPCSQMMALISRAGVTSKAGL